MATTDKKSLLSEDKSSNTQLLTDARSKSLDNAHQALLNAFGPKLAGQINELSFESHLKTSDVSESEISELIREIENAPDDDDMIKECRHRLDEAKSATPTEKEKMYEDIRRKFSAYVQQLPHQKKVNNVPISDTDKAVKGFLTNKNRTIEWISYEGSIIMSALAAVSDGGSTVVNLSQLPDDDKTIVKGILGHRIFGVKHESIYIFFQLDEYKNFDCSVDVIDNGKTKVNFTLGNRVASIPPHEASKGGSDVKVERKGKDIVIGDRIKLEKNRIQNLVSPVDPTHNGANRGGFVARPKTSGRNAYEIRADVLEMALDWAKTNTEKKLDTEDVVDIAEAFYTFVEHK